MTTETKKCKRCDIHYQKDHICVDLSYRVPGEANVQNGVYKPVKRKGKESRGDFHSFGSDFARPQQAGPDVNPFRQKRSW